MFRNLFFIIFALFAFTPDANATKVLTSPYVTKGKLTTEWRGGYEHSDDRDDAFRTRNQISYGFTDFYELKISADTRNSGKTDFTALGFENKFALAPKGEWPVDTAIRFDYVRALNGNPDQIGTKIIFAKTIWDFSNILNLDLKREIGEEADHRWETGFSYAISHPVTEDLALGLEWYGDLGTISGGYSRQDHRVGPVLYGSAFDKMKYQFGVLGGVSDAAPDVTYKGTINYSFQF